jgi:hypothetical protein
MRLSNKSASFILALAWGVAGCGSLVQMSLAQEGTAPSTSSHTTQEKRPAAKGNSQTHPTQTRPASKSKPPSHPTHTQPSAQQKPQTQASGRDKGKEKPAPLTFTDEDLKKYHPDGVARPARSTPAPEGGDPLKAFKDEEAKASWRKARAAELQQKVNDLESKLKLLQQRRLSIQNPLLPRVAEPGESSQSETGMSGPELLARTDEEIKHTNLLLESARKDLASFLEKPPE